MTFYSITTWQKEKEDYQYLPASKLHLTLYWSHFAANLLHCLVIQQEFAWWHKRGQSSVVSVQSPIFTIRLTLFPAPPTLITSCGSMASTQSNTSLLLWERVVVTMRLSPGTSCSWNPKAPKPSIPHMVLPKSAPSPSCWGTSMN